LISVSEHSLTVFSIETKIIIARRTKEKGTVESKHSFIERLQTGVLLSGHTTFKIGGPARFYFEPRTRSDFSAAVSWALSEKIRLFILGGGSNVLFHDNGFPGMVINTKRLTEIETEGRFVSAQCGVRIDDFVCLCRDHALSGLEFAAGLPGTVGGALFMNARAYGNEIADIVETVSTIEVREGTVSDVDIPGNALLFSYKSSIFQKRPIFVFSVRFGLTPGDRREIGSRIDQVRAKRNQMGQNSFPNAGCIFKNDYTVGVPSGQLIDECGLKGMRVGDAEVYRKHANFIINRGNAKASDVYALIRIVEKEVLKKKGVALEREIKLVGEWDEPEEKDFGRIPKK
jgi:UDP-N-acetylmuramate dehydrogenase